MTTAPPLTTAKLGSTRCVGCEKLFAKTPDMPVVDTVANIPNTGRVDSTGSRHRGIGTHEVTRRWHESCLTDFEARNAAYRAQVEDDRWNMIRTLCEAQGLDFETVKAEHEARKQEGTTA